MTKLLKSDITQKEIEETGFIKIQLCSPEKMDNMIEETNHFIHSLDKKYLKGFVALANIDDSYIRLASAQLVRKHVSSLVDDIISSDAESIAGVHLIKPFGIKGKLGLHYDCNLVDESNSFSISVWVPLQDCNSWNGTLSVVPYSHLIKHPQRSIGLTDPFKGYYHQFNKLARAVNVKKGEAVLFHTALLHGSNINLSFKKRIAVNYLVKPKDQPLIHYFRDTKTPLHMLEKYAVDDLFFKTKDISLRPDSSYLFLGLEKQHFESVGINEIKNITNFIASKYKK